MILFTLYDIKILHLLLFVGIYISIANSSLTTHFIDKLTHVAQTVNKIKTVNKIETKHKIKTEQNHRPHSSIIPLIKCIPK